MPGVPSGRGCGECRKSKKKCDQQQPACSRCARLKLECVGGGQRRFKFVEPTLCRNGSHGSISSSSEQSRSVTPLEKGRQSSFAVSVSPSSKLSVLASCLVASIDPCMDDRYNLVGTYGPFLSYIPSRLGRNKALDAAVAVLVEAHTCMCTRSGVTPKAISKHTHALTQLRLALDDPTTARAAETLCAAMIMSICDGMIGDGDRWGNGHIAGMSRLLQYRGDIHFTSTTDAFEQQLLATMRGPVAFEALWSDHNIFSDDDWHDFARNYEGGGPDRRVMLCMSRVPVFLRRGKAWISGKTDPTLVHDITATYQTAQLASIQLADLSDQLQGRFTRGEVDSKVFFRINFALERLYPLALSVVVVMGCLLTGVNPLYPGLQEEMRRCAVENYAIAQRLNQFRPLGSSAVPLCLSICWAGTDDMEVKQQIERVMTEYMKDYPAAGSAQSLLDSLRPLENKLKLRC